MSTSKKLNRPNVPYLNILDKSSCAYILEVVSIHNVDKTLRTEPFYHVLKVSFAYRRILRRVPAQPHPDAWLLDRMLATEDHLRHNLGRVRK